MSADLRPHESISLTIALSQLHRGEEVTSNVGAVCILALARLAGRVDYDADETAYSVPAPGGAA